MKGRRGINSRRSKYQKSIDREKNTEIFIEKIGKASSLDV